MMLMNDSHFMKFLLSKKAKPTSDALQYARTRGHTEIEQMLLAAGAKEKTP